MRFPLGGLRKPDVRQIAADAGLPVATKVDSQDLCFLAGTDRARFMARHADVPDRDGTIETTQGDVLGRHRGHHRFTVGQRRGLGIAADAPLYVLDKDPARNRVLVGPRAELRTTSVPLRGVRLHRPAGRVDRVKLRYRSRPVPARVTDALEAGIHRALTVELLEPVDGVAPGQLACLMDGELVVGWGTIARAVRRSADREVRVAHQL
jgi:tRNA-specific 2-thiouridylase